MISEAALMDGVASASKEHSRQWLIDRFDGKIYERSDWRIR